MELKEERKQTEQKEMIRRENRNTDSDTEDIWIKGKKSKVCRKLVDRD